MYFCIMNHVKDSYLRPENVQVLSIDTRCKVIPTYFKHSIKSVFLKQLWRKPRFIDIDFLNMSNTGLQVIVLSV